MTAQSLSHRDDFIDCLRALAIILVILVHYRYDIVPGGSIGVSIFFCLSGYLITSLLLDEPTLDLSAASRFIVRRFFRIYPPFVIAVLLNYFALRYSGSPRLTDFINGLPWILMFDDNPSVWISMGIGVFWTLRIEFVFYLFMPILMLITGRGKLFLFTLPILFIISFYCRVRYVAFSLAWMDTLLWGVVVAVAIRHEYIRTILRSNGIQKYIPNICFALLILIAIFVANEDRYVAWQIEAVLASFITAIWLAVYLCSGKTIVSPSIAWFGRISYSLYLVHAIPLDYVGLFPWFSSITFGRSKLWAIIITCIVVAVFMHYLIEKPAIYLGRKLTSARSKGSLSVIPSVR